jgi:hypothetical protein
LLPSSILDHSAPAPAAAPVQAPTAQPTAPLPRQTTPAAPADGPAEKQLSAAAAGLPRRQPGAQVPQTTPAMPAAGDPIASEPERPAAQTEPADTEIPPAAAALPATWSDAVSTRPVEPAAAGDSPAEHRLSPQPTAAEYVAASETPPPAASASDLLSPDRPVYPPLEDSEAEADTPIFRAVRSAWLSANATMESWHYSEIEAGWAEADRVAETEASVIDAGLPMRRPGTRLVPGGVAKPATVGVRDPDAIRSRLAAHAAGVSRGRAAATTAPDQPPEESPA